MARAEAADAELTALARRRALAAGATSAVVVVCVGAAVVGVLAVGVSAVHAHRMEPVMLAVLPLAALGAFEPVPALALAALRTGDVVAAGRRLLALEAVPVPVVDPGPPSAVPTGAAGRRAQRRPSPLRRRPAVGPPRPRPGRGPRRANGGGRGQRGREIQRGQRAAALLAPVGGRGHPGRNRPRARSASPTCGGRWPWSTRTPTSSPAPSGTTSFCPGPSAADDEVAEAVRLAQLDRWVATLARRAEHAGR